MGGSKTAYRVERYAAWSSSFSFDDAVIRLHEIAWIDAEKDFSFVLNPGTKRVLLVYFLNGEGDLTYKNACFTLHPGQVLLIDTEPGYSVKSHSDNWRFAWVQVSGRLASELLVHITKHLGYAFRANRELPSMLNKVYELSAGGQWSQRTDIALSCVLYNLFGQLFMEARSDGKTDAAVHYIKMHYMDALRVETLARLCSLSPYHFIRCFKEENGMTPVVYIIQTRIHCAKRLLLESRHSIEQIAFEVGYDDPSYFARTFKRYTGYLPKDFRRLSF